MDSSTVYLILYMIIAYVIAIIGIALWFGLRHRGKDEINIMYPSGRRQVWRKPNRDGETYTIFKERNTRKEKLPEWKAKISSSASVIPFKTRFGKMKLAFYIKPYAPKFIEFIEEKVIMPVHDRETSHSIITLEAWRRYGEGDKQKLSGILLIMAIMLGLSLVLNVLIAFKVLRF
jgi:hypothetical protein